MYLTAVTLSVLLTCCLMAATLPQASVSQPLNQLEAQQTVTSPRASEMLLIALCWDGQGFTDECQKHKVLIRQLLYKLLYSLKKETRVSESDTFVDEEDGRIPMKRRREDNSGFYSNW
ncbi:uncharacterized protein LOC131928445 [Physella acuta]|uniref:uncharacterized protein LOC131928445 n=1 Tax=Physella acuta TaxID=109671 RepID=UPI0027DB6A8A|nr:uncharacterized protein LOC131928445 [Physella acuta]